MDDYFLKNYDLSKGQVVQSLFVSEYALRHFSAANQSASWNGRLIHTLIGAIQLIPILGPIGSAMERGIAHLKNKNLPERKIEARILDPNSGHRSETNVLEKTAQTIQQTPAIQDAIAPEVKPVKAFHTRINALHPCLNERNPPLFKQPTQGFLKLPNLFSDKDKKNIQYIRVNFTYQDKPFHIQFFSPSDSMDIFLSNMPANENVQFRFTAIGHDRKALDLNFPSFDFLVNEQKGEYQFIGTENDMECTFTALKDVTQQEIPQSYNSIYTMPSIDLSNPLRITLSGNEKLSWVEPEEDVASSEHYTVNNQTNFTQLLTFELGNYRGKDRLPVSFPIVISPGETKKISQDSLFKAWDTGYRLATQNSPRPPNLELALFSIQQDIYQNE